MAAMAIGHAGVGALAESHGTRARTQCHAAQRTGLGVSTRRSKINTFRAVFGQGRLGITIA